MLELVTRKIRNRRTYLRDRATIRKHDAAVDHRSWGGAEFHERHFAPFPLPEPSGASRDGIHREMTIDARMGMLAAQLIEDFRERIVGFLGSGVRLDDIYVFRYDPSKASAAGSYSHSWHDDNVGHRLKIFACFEGDGSTPTVVVPHSYNKPYARRFGELLRFRGFKSTGRRANEIRLAYRPGDVAIFDTSCLHRGDYGYPAARRVVLVMEFMDRDKCNAIAGGLPCAPGMSPLGKVLFTPEAHDALKQTGLLDEALIAAEGGLYSYSFANRR